MIKSFGPPRLLSMLVACGVLNGCISQITLDRAIMAYNEATSEVLSK